MKNINYRIIVLLYVVDKYYYRITTGTRICKILFV